MHSLEKEEKQNLFAKIGIDTAENEPSELQPAYLPAPDPWVEKTAMRAWSAEHGSTCE